MIRRRFPLVRLGISACLVGQQVRYDGGHKRDTYLVGVVGPSVAWVPVYPDVTHRPQTRRSPTNVLQHLAGYASNRLDSDARGELTAMIEQYRRGVLPLIVPVTLLRHDVRKFQIPQPLDQVYLTPHPHALMLLNHLWCQGV